MYKEHFGFKELPFSIAPDPRFLYMSEQHQEALAHLLYGINTEGGFVLLTGEVGTGKTTVCRCLLEQIPENVDIAFILNPKVTVTELLATFCDELDIRYNPDNKSVKVFVDLINEYLLDAHSRGRKTVLIIEEAQNLSADVLEQIRLLTNLETNKQKLLQIIMVGQPEIREMLSRSELRQLSQRITARYHIGMLSLRDTGEYVKHRLSVAGITREIFPDSLFSRLFRLSQGIPRLINVICDRALLGAYVQGKDKIDKKTLVTAAKEIAGNEGFSRHPGHMLQWFLTGLLIIVFAVAISAAYQMIKKEDAPDVEEITAKDSKVVHLETIDWSNNVSIEQSKEIAFKTLFRQWDISYIPEGQNKECEFARKNGLRCLEGIGSFQNIINMNKPSVLKLFNDKESKYFVTLISWNNDQGSLSVGDKIITTNRKEIEKYWLGEYVLLWRPPVDFQRNIRPGASGAEIIWLQNQLDKAQGIQVSSNSKSVYEKQMIDQIKQFQIAQGLIPDGIIGPETVIQLNNVTHTDEPKLLRKE